MCDHFDVWIPKKNIKVILCQVCSKRHFTNCVVKVTVFLKDTPKFANRCQWCRNYIVGSQTHKLQSAPESDMDMMLDIPQKEREEIRRQMCFDIDNLNVIDNCYDELDCCSYTSLLTNVKCTFTATARWIFSGERNRRLCLHDTCNMAGGYAAVLPMDLVNMRAVNIRCDHCYSAIRSLDMFRMIKIDAARETVERKAAEREAKRFELISELRHLDGCGDGEEKRHEPEKTPLTE